MAASPSRSSRSTSAPLGSAWLPPLLLAAAMRSRPPARTPTLALRLRPGDLAVPGAVLRDRRQLRNRGRLRRRGQLGLAQDRRGRHALALHLGLADLRLPLRLALLEDRQERRGDEDGRVRTGRDPDHQREREVLERRAAEDQERGERQQRDERRRERTPDRLPQ